MSAQTAAPRGHSLIAVDGSPFTAAAACEPLTVLRTGEAAGWRFAPRITNADGPMDMTVLDWRDAEQADFAVLDQAVERLAESGRGPGLALVAVSFSTLSSTRGRRELGQRLADAVQVCGRPIALELGGLRGVPPARLAEVAAHIRPACAGLIAEVGPHRAEIAAIGHCGFAGVIFRTRTDWSGDPGQLARYQALTALARGSASRCITRACADDLAIVAAAGFTHAAVSDG